MKLSTEDAGLFFKLMWGLQFYVNRRQKILSGIDSVETYAKLPTEDRIEVRNALWKNLKLVDAYAAENPDRLPSLELDIVQKWNRAVSGTFQIFRYLKKHTIFVRDDSQVYGVLGLHNSVEDAMYGRQLPVMVQAVLLPFKGKIVYDGVLPFYNIYFGGGIRSGLNEAYMTAKQNDRIITTLEPELATPARQEREKSGQDWGPVIDDLVQTASKMKGGPVVQSSAFSVLRASARLAQAAVQNPDDLDELQDLEQRVRNALTRLQTVLNRAGG